jgi:hypothetical protein
MALMFLVVVSTQVFTLARPPSTRTDGSGIFNRAEPETEVEYRDKVHRTSGEFPFWIAPFYNSGYSREYEKILPLFAY